VILRVLAAGHFLRQVYEKFLFAVIHARKSFGKLAKLVGMTAVRSPGFFRIGSGQLGHFYLLAIGKESIQRDFQRASKLFESFDVRNGEAVLYAADVAAKKSCFVLDVALR